MSGTPINFEGEWFVRLVLDKNLSRPPPFKLGGPHDLEITIAPIEDERLRAMHPDAVRCIASGRWSANATLTTAFEHMSRGMLPDGRDPGPAWEELEKTLLTRALAPGATRAYTIEDLYPEHVRTWLRGVHTELRDAALTLLGVVRWRMDARGGHNPIRAERGLWFSLDGETGHPVSLGLGTFHGWSETHARIEPDIHEQILQYVTNNESQPIGHELLREAFTTRNANPRSALVVAVAALEVGVKEYVAARTPAAEWLAFNVPSPPVVTLLTDYFPKLETAAEAYRQPPDVVVKILKKAITLRNAVTHKGEANISQESLVEIMATISDVLRVLDYYRGYKWSRAYVTEQIAKRWLDGED